MTKIGEYIFERKRFPNGGVSGDPCRSLLDLILAEPQESFLLSEVIDFISRTPGLESFEQFEHWLVEESGLPEGEQYLVRGKIAGKYLPRDEYQVYFPVGGGRIHPGPHFVTAHNPPDLDTSVASFWGWVDAFACRVATGLHVWNFPGGSPTPDIYRLFDQMVGGAVFDVAARHEAVIEAEERGTVTLRDFCNREETKLSRRLSVISVIDHHRAALNTSIPPVVTLSDAQSCNVVVAELAMALNDRYCCMETSGEVELGEDASSLRMARRALDRRLADRTRGQYFVHPRRVFVEYMCFLHAILDDTDLLSRVTLRDVLCVGELVNRLKSLITGRDVEVIDFDDLARDEEFVQRAARRLLQNEDLYSLYSRIYERRELELHADLERCREGLTSNVFADTKEQKGCARVGQTKLFANNFHWFAEHGDAIRQAWLEKVAAVHRNAEHLNLHLHMVSTIAGAEEVHSGGVGEYGHADELWLWVPHTEEAHERLSTYLSGFREEVLPHDPVVELIGPNPQVLCDLFADHFSGSPVRVTPAPKLASNMAVMRFRPGVITSRKTHITPHLPKSAI